MADLSKGNWDMAAVGSSALQLTPDERYAAALAAQDTQPAEQILAAFDAVLEEDPWHVGALLHAGALALDAGRNVQARGYYQTLFNLSDEEIMANLDPANLKPEGVESLASLCDVAMRIPLCLQIVDRVVACRPQDAAARATYGRLLYASGKAQEGVMQLRRATDLDPNCGKYWETLGKAYAQTGALEKGCKALERAVELMPEAHELRRELILVLTKLSRKAECLRHYRILAKTVDDNAGILCEVGLALLNSDDPAGAHAAFAKVLTHKPDNCLAGLGAGAACLALKRPEEGIDRIKHALAFVPGSPPAILALIRCYNGRLPNAALNALYNAGIDLAHDNPDDLRALCDEAYGRRFGDAAHRGLTRLQELVPDAPGVLAALIDTRLSVCDWGDVTGLEREVLELVDRRIDEGRPLNIDVWNLFALGVDYPTLAKAARYKAAWLYKDMEPVRRKLNASFRAVERPRIRLGYLAPYTWKSSHIDNLLTVVRQHDRERFELYGYTVNPWGEDAYDVGFRGQFEQFRYLNQSDPESCGRQVLADEIDILIDSTGHFASTCMPTAALRPAPVIVHGTAGFNIIGGAPYYDYSLNDRYYLPDEFVDLYVEKPFYMPHSAMPAEQLPIEDYPVTRADARIPEGSFVFADFNHPCKFDPRVFDAWMEILHRVPNSVLLLGRWLDDTSARLHRIVENRGVDKDRVIFAQVMPRNQHLRRLQLCDLALDTFYHSGGVTSVDCMMAGLPLLSVVPDRPLPLANLSLLAASDCADMVMPDLESYIARAVELAHRPDELAEIRARLLESRGRAPLLQAERWVRNFERCCEIMHSRRLDGDDPAPFSVLDVQDWPA